jgi:DNA-directed RNA polymerase subunit RPC12/RpoP
MSATKYVCQACANEFPESAIGANRRDDYPCPVCGRLRLKRMYTSLERLRAALMTYNTY